MRRLPSPYDVRFRRRANCDGTRTPVDRKLSQDSTHLIPPTPPSHPHWWPLMSAPRTTAEKTMRSYREAMLASGAPTVAPVMELGSGGGNNASQLNGYFGARVDSPRAECRQRASIRVVNPSRCMSRSDRPAGRRGFVHDAVVLNDDAGGHATRDETALVHCRTGGVALFGRIARETFEVQEHGGMMATTRLYDTGVVLDLNRTTDVHGRLQAALRRGTETRER